jgi:hypothetical protein
MSASLKDDVDATDSGFRAELTGVSLADLVQLECAARSSRAFRVRSGNAVGYLYFSDGQIVHAATDNAVGEAAAVELLSWSDGAFEASALPLPQSPTIRRSWQHLLLMAAQAHDEVRRKKLVSFPKSHRAPNPVEAPRPEPRASATHTASAVVRADPSASVVRRAGGDHAASIAAYAVRLADLIGEDLGVGPVAALEVELGSTRVFVHRDEEDNAVGTTSSSEADAAALRQRLSL